MKGFQAIAIKDIYSSSTTNWILNIDKVNDQNMYGKESITFSPGTDLINVQFNAISYSVNETPFVSYRIPQLHDEWRTTQNTQLEFVNIKPGTYDFELRLKGQYKHITITIDAAIYETTWFWVLTTIVFLLSVSAGFISYIRNKELRLRQHLDKIQLQQIVLTTRLNPHFIFNSLSSLQTLILQQKTMESVQFLSSFSNLMRQLLDRSGETFTVLLQEKEFIQRYIEVENKRFRSEITIDWQIQDQIDIQQYKIPSMLLQPLVENCVQHGFRNFNPKGVIQIRMILLSENCIEIAVMDDGRGINNHKKSHRTSKSTSLIQERIMLLGNINHENYSFTIADRSTLTPPTQGTQITMRLPYEIK